MTEIQTNILQWATEKGIFEKSTAQTQMKKLFEEVHELDAEISKLPYAYKKDVQLEFGDVLVVLTILAKMLDTDFETCLSMAYNKIKDRTGKMENGTFVKD